MMARKTSSTSDTPTVTSLASSKAKTLVVNKKVSSSRARSRPGSHTLPTSAVGQDEPDSDSPHLHARIADRAHEIFIHRGGHHGQDCEDWFEAERQIMEEEY